MITGLGKLQAGNFVGLVFYEPMYCAGAPLVYLVVALVWTMSCQPSCLAHRGPLVTPDGRVVSCGMLHMSLFYH